MANARGVLVSSSSKFLGSHPPGLRAQITDSLKTAILLGYRQLQRAMTLAYAMEQQLMALA
jgi:hypothetical protein